MTLLTFVLVAAFGLLVGTLSGMFGIGGGTMMIPLMNLVFRIPILTATATSLFVIAPTSLVGALRHVRQGSVDVRAALVIGASGALASVGSSLVSGYLPETLITLAAVAVIIYSAVTMVLNIRKAAGAAGGGVGASGGVRAAAPGGTVASGGAVGAVAAGATANSAAADAPAAATYAASGKAAAGVGRDAAAADATAPHTSPKNNSRFKTRRGQLLAQVCLGLFAGFVAGIVGVGGGFVIVPISIAYFGYSFKQASGTSLLAIVLIVLPGILVHALLGHIVYLYGLALMLGSVPGADIGARIVARIPERAARIAFSLLLAVAGVMLLVNDLVFGLS